MNLLLRVFAFAVIVKVSNISCDTRSNVYYQKCQEYQTEDERLGENAMNPHVQIEVLGKLSVGTIISPDTILSVVSDVHYREVTIESFKVYLKPGDNDWFRPESFSSNDRFMVLKMSDVHMEQLPRRRACLQMEFPHNSVLHVLSYNEHNSFIMMVGKCTRREHLTNNICIFNNTFADQPIANNSVVLHINYPQINIVGSYFENYLPLIKLFDENAIKWIESETWSTAYGNSVQQSGQAKLSLSPLGSFGTYYHKCQVYRAEDENLDENAKQALVKIKISGKSTLAGIMISPDTILVISDPSYQNVTADSFKVYLNDDEWFAPESVFTNDRFIVLKMNEIIMNLYPRRRACIQSEFPKWSLLHVPSYDDNDGIIMRVGKCLRREYLADDVCAFNNWIVDQPNPTNSVVISMHYPYMNIIGYFIKNMFLIKLIDDHHIKWIESVTWRSTTTNSIQQCGQIKSQLSSSNTHSIQTRSGEFPWHAAIFNNTVYVCGGTIINTRAILTAAHCVQNELGITSNEMIRVVVGLYNRNNRDTESQKLIVQNVIPNEHFDSIYYKNDIAVLRLVEIIEYTNFVQPICVRRAIQQNTNEMTVPSWGVDELGIYQDVLQKVAVFAQSTQTCRKANSGYFRQYLTEGSFCAANENGTSMCTRDSGGGLIAMEKHEWTLSGVVSLINIVPSQEQCHVTNLVLLTNTTFFYDWIVDKAGWVH